MILKKLEEYNSKNYLIHDNDTIFVAVSGGADSMAMLAYLESIKEAHNLSLIAVHVNHGIRGETADRDAEFVRSYCEKHNIKFKIFDARENGVEVPENPSEDWARELRYNYFEQLANSHTEGNKSVKVATAHTLSDQAETILFRLARGGVGLNGLSGIPVKRGNIIRPLLCITREEVEELVEHFRTGYITDETNLEDTYSRNRIRHHVVPVMKGINDSFEHTIEKLCNKMEKVQEYIEKMVSLSFRDVELIEWVKYKALDFTERIISDEAIADEMLLQILDHHGVKSEKNVDRVKKALREHHSSEVVSLDLGNNIEMYLDGYAFSFVDRREKDSIQCENGFHMLSDFCYGVNIKEVTAEEFKKDGADKRNLCHYACESKLRLQDAKIRTKKEGDTFKPAKRVKGKVTKFMRDVPVYERNEVPLVEYNDTIVWMWEQGFTDGMLPSEQDILEGKKIYKFESV